MKEYFLDKMEEERYRYNREGGGREMGRERDRMERGGSFEKERLEEFYKEMGKYFPDRIYEMRSQRESGSSGRRRRRRREAMETMPLSFVDMAEEYTGGNDSMRQFFDKIQYNLSNMDEEEKEELHKVMRSLHQGIKGEHFNEQYAKHEVSKMFHIEGNKKYVGEKFDMSKAREVYEMFRSMIPQDNTIADIYVAINAQFHDYIVLFRSWFGNNAEQKIIEAAVNFWFKDDDCPEGKVWDYFRE